MRFQGDKRLRCASLLAGIGRQLSPVRDMNTKPGRAECECRAEITGASKMRSNLEENAKEKPESMQTMRELAWEHRRCGVISKKTQGEAGKHADDARVCLGASKMRSNLEENAV